MLPFFVPQMRYHWSQVVAGVIAEGMIGPGRYNQKFKEALEDYTGAPWVYLTTSGTKALELAVRASELPFASEVIVPVYGFVATTMAMILAGLRPRFVDVNAWGHMTAEAVEAAIGINTSAVCFVNFNGMMDGIAEVKAVCDKHHLVLIEDAAPSIGHTLNKKHGGTVGDIGILSFAPNKLLTTGQGGAVLCSRYKQYSILESYCNQGDPERTGYSHAIGGNYRMSDINARLGLAQLQEISDLIKNRQHQEWLLERCAVPLMRGNSGPSLYNLIRTKDAEAVKAKCKTNGVDARTQFIPLHLHEPFQQYLRVEDKFPVAMQLFHELLYLPFGFGLTDEELEEVAGVLHGQPVLA